MIPDTPHIDPRSILDRSRIDPGSIQNRSRIDPGARILECFLGRANFGPFLKNAIFDQKWSLNLEIDEKSLNLGPRPL